MPAPTIETLNESARALLPWIVERRRHLHRNPELSFQERETSAFVAAELAKIGHSAIHTGLNGNHSICVEIDAPGDRPLIALRADMDALPIEEQTPSDFRSQKPGISHMCGHDAHTSMLLGVARLLHEQRDALPGPVRLFFQGGEETLPGGAKDFIETGWLEGVQSIYGIHVHPLFDTGTLHIAPGPAMAGATVFHLQVIGKGGHAAFPHETIDPVLCSAHMITNLQQIVARSVNPLESAVVSVTRIHAGEASNIIPERVALSGTIRSYRPDWHEHFTALLARVCEGVAAAHGCRVEIDARRGYPPVLNDAAATARMERVAAGVFASGAEPVEPVMGAEDFAFYTEHVPGCFAFLGVAAPDDRERFMLHHPRFHIDEGALWRGTALLAGMAFQG